MSIPSKCNLCSSKSNKQNVVTQRVYGKKGHSFFKCETCEVIYQFPFLTKKEEEFFYKMEFEKFMNNRVGDKGSWENIKQHQIDNKSAIFRRMKYLKPFLKTKKNILEIGCSSGFMLNHLSKMGHKCYGIEPSGLFQKYLKNKIELFKDLKNIKNKKFDLIIHFFVLEHIRDPFKFFKQQKKLLNKGGKIIFEIPCYNDALYQLYDIHEFEKFYWSVAHPWYFNKNSLKFLLKKNFKRFKILPDQRYDFSNHMCWALNRKPGGMGYFTNKLGKKFEDTYKRNLIKRGYYDTLFGIIG